ncbi:MAG: NnrS family protein [bacterium]
MLIEEKRISSGFALWALGFRPFFLGAMLFAVCSVMLWMAVYTFSLPVPTGLMGSFQWHAHEMIFGYAMAVIAGFLLTAVGNWTGRKMPGGWWLAGIFSLWAAARLGMAAGILFIEYAAVADILFGVVLISVLGWHLVIARQWSQMGILAKVMMLWMANLVFYLGAMSGDAFQMRLGLYGGLLLVIGLILMMGRRVVPFFIEKGIPGGTQLRNSKPLDIALLTLFLIFFGVELFAPLHWSGAWLGIAMFLLNSIRLQGWYHPGIWQNPLLWGLYLAMFWITLGFLLHALAVWGLVSQFIAVHALAYGGIGTITMAMMARVTLGHTGRNVQQPTALMGVALLLLTVGTIVRVLLPAIMPTYTWLWIPASMMLWIAAFFAMVWTCAPMHWMARIDGRPG